MLDYAVSGLANGLEQWLSARFTLVKCSWAIICARTPARRSQRRLSELSLRLTKSMAIDLERRQQAIANIGRLLDANSFERVLDRGFALVTDQRGCRSNDRQNCQNMLMPLSALLMASVTQHLIRCAARQARVQNPSLHAARSAPERFVLSL